MTNVTKLHKNEPDPIADRAENAVKLILWGCIVGVFCAVPVGLAAGGAYVLGRWAWGLVA